MRSKIVIVCVLSCSAWNTSEAKPRKARQKVSPAKQNVINMRRFERGSRSTGPTIRRNLRIHAVPGALRFVPPSKKDRTGSSLAVEVTGIGPLVLGVPRSISDNALRSLLDGLSTTSGSPDTIDLSIEETFRGGHTTLHSIRVRGTGGKKGGTNKKRALQDTEPLHVWKL